MLGDVAAIKVAREMAVSARVSTQVEAETALAAIGIAELARTTAAETQARCEADAATTAVSLASLESEAAALNRDLATATGALSQVRAAHGYEVALEIGRAHV